MTSPKTNRRSLLVDCLIILFGISSWVAVNGLWVELPLLVKTLPESWKLASYIIIVSQIANLGPITFSAVRRLLPLKTFEVPLIHASLATVFVACGLLTVFWDTTSYIADTLHSTALLILTFIISCVDCTSSLLYLPFIANFKEQYVISYMIGTGLSGPVPAIMALAQGVGGYAECKNITVTNVTESGNITEYIQELYYPPPRFSAHVFFALLCAQMGISWIAFILLNELPQAWKEKERLIPISRPSNPAVTENFQSSVEKDFSSSIEQTQNLLGKPILTLQQFYTLFALQGFVCTLYNAILSVQTYSCLPYGSLPYHLSVTLASISNPICCFIAMFLPVTSIRRMIGFTIFAASWGGYILAMALLSPTPPLVGAAFGSFLMVFAWITVSGTIAFIKACIVNMLRSAGGHTALYRCGIVTQVGSAAGAFVMFLLVDQTNLFQSFTPCSS